MKKSSIGVVVTTCLLLTVCATNSLSAQSAPPRTANSVVVIDIIKVFDQHSRFKQSMEALKADAKTFEDFVRREQQRFKQSAEQLKEFKTGSPEYKRIEEQLAQDAAGLQAKAAINKNSFLQREAKLYYDAYSEVTNEISSFCDQRGISIVLRYDSKSIDPENRISVQKGINKSIVFQRNLDITGIIIQRVNQNARGNQNTATRPGPPIPGR